MPRRLSPLVLRDTSGVHQLPPELLSYIFELACLDYSPFDNDRAEHFLRPFGTETIKPPVVFSGVCKRWRSVAHATGSIVCPFLHKSILLLQRAYSGREFASQLNYFFRMSPFHRKLCEPTTFRLFCAAPRIARSTSSSTPEIHTGTSQSQGKLLPFQLSLRHSSFFFLSFRMGIGAYSPPFSAAHMSTALMLLLPHIIRWRSLDIMTDIWCTIHAALTAINEHMTSTGASFPRLESLTLMRCNDYVRRPAFPDPWP
jgi:hypothetical protein